METSSVIRISTRLVAVAFIVATLSSCSDRKPPEQAVVPPPAADESIELVPAWAERTNSVLTLKANFAKTGAARTIWDIPLKCDLRVRSGIQFDFWCDDLRPFTGFSCYFKSGKGWYHGTFSPDESGVWQRVVVRKADTRVEDTPAGWGEITQIRISGWRGPCLNATCKIANVSYLGGGRPDVAIVYAGSLVEKAGAAGKAYMTFAGNIAASLEAIGISCSIVADTDLTEKALEAVDAVVLPYNPSFPADKFPLIKRFVESGRRMLACYALPGEIADLMGVRQKSVIRPVRPIRGFLKVGSGLPGQPEFSPQASWMTQRVEVPPFAGEVVATWATGDRVPLDIPALVRVPGGIYMAHVWLGGTQGAPAALMRAIVRHLAPSLNAKVEAREELAAKRREKDREWLAAQKPKAGEFRAFWCHSARGLGGGRTWDESVRILKENGFNAVLPNLAWGGAAYYRSAVLPQADDVAERGDALDQCLSACRRHGVQCHVWKVCWNMGNCTPQTFVDAMVASNRTQVSFGGKSIPRWLCPSHPDNQNLEIEAMLEIARKKPDGVHFDYIRYPDSGSCFCAGCRARFETGLGAPVTNWPACVRAEERLRRAWQDFRTSNIAHVVETVSRRVRAEVPGVKVSAAVFQNLDTAPSNVGQDWPAWCRAGWMDFVCPMDYIDSAALFRNQVAQQKADVKGARVYPGIGLSTWRNDGQDAIRLAKQIMAVRELGLGGYSVFNLDGRAEKVLPLLHLGVTRDR